MALAAICHSDSSRMVACVCRFVRASTSSRSGHGGVIADRFVLPSGDGAWASDEIWSYRTDDRLRITALEGAQPIDPIQAGVPAIWRDAPTYRLARAGTVAIAERSRGLNREDANRLQLQRDLWYAFDHDGFDAVDHVTGTMQQGWRLDMLRAVQAAQCARCR